MLELRNHSHSLIFQMRAWGSRLHISESVIELGVDLELLTKSSAPTLDYQGHWPSLRWAEHWVLLGKGLLTLREPGPALVSTCLSHSTSPAVVPRL